MTAGTATRRGQREVAVDLAASVLAIQRCVGAVLASQSPRIGHIGAQARAAFVSRRADWLKMARPAVQDTVALAPAGAIPVGADMVDQCVRDLGDNLDIDAAGGLDVAMDIQLSRGQHPDVAWQRAVAGYGLADAAMRGYISAALTPGKDGGTPLLSVSRSMASRALLAQADRIGTRETAAWSTLPVTAMAKNFDPHQKRAGDGRWTRTGGGAPRARVKEKERAAPDAVDDLLARVTPERYADVPHDDDRYRYTDDGRYRYADVPYDSQRYGGDRYRHTDDGRYRGAAAEDDRYLPKVEPRNTINRVFLFGGKAPNETPPEPEHVDAGGFGLYLPMGKIRDYLLDTDRTLGAVPGRRTGTTVNFTRIADHLENVRDDPEPIELRGASSPWEVAQGVEDIDPDVWSDILTKAVKLWHDVQEEPLRAVDQLKGDVYELAEWAGYPPSMGKQQILEEIRTNYEMRENGVLERTTPDGVTRYYDRGLLDALADYVVWRKPKSWGAEGSDLAGDLEHRLGGAMDDAPLPEVMSFGDRLAPDEDGGRMRGQYAVDTVRYRSAIGTFGGGAPAGKFAMREIQVKPERM